MPEITRRAAIAALGGAVAGRAAQIETRPNTLIILVDDLRWDALGCTGHPFAKTPGIDRIAKEGARFDNAFVTTPLDSPSRATLFSGQYAHQHDIRTNGENGAPSMRLKTFVQMQQQAGYETALIGKWAMGTEDAPRPGFDRWVSFKGQGQYFNPIFNIDGKPVQQTGYVTDLLNAQAVDFIRKRRGRPFSLILSHKAVHAPHSSPERHRTLYANDVTRRAPSVPGNLDGKPALRKKADAEPPRPMLDDMVRQQLQSLASVDEGVAKIFAALEETRQLDNTLIVFTSDNGFLWGEHGLTDKRVAYDESIRVPLLVRRPLIIRPGTRLRNFVLNVDLAPTILEVSRVAPAPEMRGRSLVPLLQGRAKAWRTQFLAEYFEEVPMRPGRTPSWQAIRTDRWKYIRYTNLDGMDEFYDLASDPYEMKNLIGDQAAEVALLDCKEDMARLWRESF